jgi:hypothetical protein
MPLLPSNAHLATEGLPEALPAVSGDDADVLEALQAKYEGFDGFLAVVHDGRSPAIVVDRESLIAWKGRVTRDEANVVPSCVPTGLLAAAKDATRAMRFDVGEFAAVAYDAITDAVIVQSTRPDAVVRSAVEAAGADRLDAGASLRTDRFASGAVSRLGSYNDFAPFYGGARIYVALGGGYYGECSTGFYLDSATNGTVMLTAGHCAEVNGHPVWNGDFSVQIGNIEGRHLPDPDLALIDGSNFSPHSYSWSNATSFKQISASANPSTAVTYCMLGATLQRRCYAYSSLTAQFCDDWGCTNNLAWAVRSTSQGAMNAGGDSGGGVFRELSATNTLSARGMVVAGGCDPYQCVAFDHKRQTITTTFDASVVTAP